MKKILLVCGAVCVVATCVLHPMSGVGQDKLGAFLVPPPPHVLRDAAASRELVASPELPTAPSTARAEPDTGNIRNALLQRLQDALTNKHVRDLRVEQQRTWFQEGSAAPVFQQHVVLADGVYVLRESTLQGVHLRGNPAHRPLLLLERPIVLQNSTIENVDIVVRAPYRLRGRVTFAHANIVVQSATSAAQRLLEDAVAQFSDAIVRRAQAQQIPVDERVIVDCEDGIEIRNTTLIAEEKAGGVGFACDHVRMYNSTVEGFEIGVAGLNIELHSSHVNSCGIGIRIHPLKSVKSKVSRRLRITGGSFTSNTIAVDANMVAGMYALPSGGNPFEAGPVDAIIIEHAIFAKNGNPEADNSGAVMIQNGESTFRGALFEENKVGIALQATTNTKAKTTIADNKFLGNATGAAIGCGVQFAVTDNFWKMSGVSRNGIYVTCPPLAKESEGTFVHNVIEGSLAEGQIGLALRGTKATVRDNAIQFLDYGVLVKQGSTVKFVDNMIVQNGTGMQIFNDDTSLGIEVEAYNNIFDFNQWYPVWISADDKKGSKATTVTMRSNHFYANNNMSVRVDSGELNMAQGLSTLEEQNGPNIFLSVGRCHVVNIGGKVKLAGNHWGTWSGGKSQWQYSTTPAPVETGKNWDSCNGDSVLMQFDPNQHVDVLTVSGAVTALE